MFLYGAHVCACLMVSHACGIASFEFDQIAATFICRICFAINRYTPLILPFTVAHRNSARPKPALSNMNLPGGCSLLLIGSWKRIRRTGLHSCTCPRITRRNPPADSTPSRHSHHLQSTCYPFIHSSIRIADIHVQPSHLSDDASTAHSAPKTATYMYLISSMHQSIIGAPVLMAGKPLA